MTTQEFLDHLGIRIGAEFNCRYPNGFTRKIKVTENPVTLHYFNPIKKSWAESEDNLGSLLDCEIIKYILSDADKVILTKLLEGYCSNDCIERSPNGVDLFIVRFAGMKDEEELVLFPLANVFNCIRCGERVRIHDLKRYM